jgi:hypothetical protein
MTMHGTLRLRTLIDDLQRELGVKIDCGQLTLNFNQSLCASVDVHQHARVTPVDDRKPLTGRTPERSFAST